MAAEGGPQMGEFDGVSFEQLHTQAMQNLVKFRGNQRDIDRFNVRNEGIDSSPSIGSSHCSDFKNTTHLQWYNKQFSSDIRSLSQAVFIAKYTDKAIQNGEVRTQFSTEDYEELQRIRRESLEKSVKIPKCHSSDKVSEDVSSDEEESTGILLSSNEHSIRIQMSPGKTSSQRRKSHRILLHDRKHSRGREKNGWSSRSNRELPFTGTEFDSPPPKPVGISLRVNDYQPDYFFVGGKLRNTPQKRRLCQNNSDINMVSQVNTDDPVNLARRFQRISSRETESFCWAPKDQNLRVPLFKNDPFDKVPLPNRARGEVPLASNTALYRSDSTPTTVLPINLPLGTNQTRRLRQRAWKHAWQNIAKKDIPREQKKMQAKSFAAQNHYRRVSFIVAKEVRRAALKLQRGARDVNLRSRRLVREMQAFWRRYEKELAERQKLEEKEAIETIRREEESREGERQQRKLEFLLTQTELFSHFIGKKMGIVSADTQAPVVDSDLHAEAAEATKEHIRATRVKASHFDDSVGLPSQELETDVDLLHPSTMPDEERIVSEPTLFHGRLKAYQLKGLNWLVNLYEQGINGILADEMGLGKTIQSICLVAYLAEVKNIWGPFVVVAPNSTLHQWKQEFMKFCPDIKVIPYWGSQKDRTIIRKFWKKKQLGTRYAPFHVCITSYSVFCNDERHFQRLKWQYMILDEAQAIKNASSQRWSRLLGLKCRNRLLLTGTPIQNSMAELWALLHFIMPTLFDSHDEFNEWFSRDIESHATGDTKKLDTHQLKRLHMILQPFMLRRVKRDVEHELSEKIEIQLNCSLSRRQRLLYKALRNRVAFSEIGDSTLSSKENLMNLVMQFRKVCNHPKVFERSSTVSPFQFSDPAYAYQDESLSSKRGLPNSDFGHIISVSHNPISLRIPRCILNDTITSYKHAEIWDIAAVHRSSFGGAFSFSRFLGQSAAETAFTFWSVLSPPLRWLAVLAHSISRQKQPPSRLNLEIVHRVHQPLINAVQLPFEYFVRSMKLLRVPHDFVHAPPIEIVCTSARQVIQQRMRCRSAWERAVMTGIPPHVSECDVRASHLIPGHIPSSLFSTVCPIAFVSSSRHTSAQIVDGLCCRLWKTVGSPSAQLFLPRFGKLIGDSGKMAVLDRLLSRLKAEGHRVLIFSQMRKMIDILQDYMNFRRYRIFRLDGGTDLADRRDMVNEFQSNSDIFAFLLSTRAGGLGITLTAADTVVFFDSDWNPTMDAQAMDRVHRIGQTKQVTVYRMVCRGTVEERILNRAQAKHEIQKTVYSGGFKMQAASKSDVDLFKRNELKEFLLDDA